MPAIPSNFFIELTTVKGASTSAAEFQHLLNNASVLSARGIPIDDTQRYALLREVASGLLFLHKLGVCVGDISPKNLLFSLQPRPAVYFIDCDAMRINGVSALPQAETPEWEVPSDEELATTRSDTYKLGLLALRLLAGDQHTRDVRDLPPTTPNQLRQLITDTLQANPERRPLPEAWTYVLGYAIEESQHRGATTSASPRPSPASEAVPVVRSRPTAPVTKKATATSPKPPAVVAASATSRPITSGWLIGGIAAAGFTLAVLIGLVVNSGSGEAPHPTRKSSAPATSTVTAGARPAPATPTIALRPPPTISYGADPDDDRCHGGADLPGGHGAAPGTENTSCGFAINVGQAYWQANPTPTSRQTVSAPPFSTPCYERESDGAKCSGADYIMECEMAASEAWITCRGGVNAEVLIW